MHLPVFLLALLRGLTALVVLSAPCRAATPPALQETWESRPIGTLATLFRAYGEPYAIAVEMTGEPLIAYADAGSSAITVVTWENGQRIDTEVAPIPTGFQGLDIATWQDRAYLAWQHEASSYNFPVYISERIDGTWSAPELVATTRNFMDLDLEVGPGGAPQIAGIVHPFAGQHEVVVFGDDGQGWAPDLVRSHNGLLVSHVAFAVTSDGIRHVAYREYSATSGNSTSRVRHARSDGGAWVTLTAFDGLLDDLVGSPSAQPHLFGTLPGTNTLHHWSFDGAAWSGETPVGQAEGPGPWRFADIAADGSLYVPNHVHVLSRIDGQWSSRPSPQTRRIAIDADGDPHFLGDQNTLLSYHRLIPDAWASSQVTDPNQGGAALGGVLQTLDRELRVYGAMYSSFSVAELAETGPGAWSTHPIPGAVFGAPFARSPDRKLHQFNGPTSYVTGDRNGMSSSFIPFNNTSGSSSDIHSMVVDADGNPHVCAIVSQGNTKTVQYAVKRCGTWSIETVDGIGFTRHVDLALDSRGAPHIVTSDGIYRRTPGGWIKDHPLDRVYRPEIVVDAADLVHTVYAKQGVWSTHGKDGTYATSLIDGRTTNDAPRRLTLFEGRPALALVAEHLFSGSVYSLRLGRWDDGEWIFETASPIAPQQTFHHVDMTGHGESGLLLAAQRSTVINFSVTPWINTHSRSFPSPPASHLSLSVAALEPATVPPRQYASGTIYVHVTNRGAHPASGVVVSTFQPLPPTILPTGATPSTGRYADGTWTLDLLAGESATLALGFRADSLATEGPLHPGFGMCITDSRPADHDFSDHYGFSHCSIVGVPDVTVTTTAPPVLDPATGLLRGVVTITNNEAAPVPGFRLAVSGLPQDMVLWNSTGPGFLAFDEALSAGERVELEVLFLSPDPDPEFVPVYGLAFVPPDPRDAPPAVRITDARRLPGGEVVLDFSSEPDTVYAVEFSSDGIGWTRVPELLTATATSSQWTDPGDGSVAPLPAGAAALYYRVRVMRVPEP